MSIKQEKRLLSRIVTDRDIGSALKAGVSVGSFFDPSAQEVFAFIERHFKAHGEVPSKHLIRDISPDFTPVQTTDSMEALIQCVREEELRNDLVSVTPLIHMASTDPEAAADLLSKRVAEVKAKYRKSNGIDARSSTSSVLDTYMTTKNAKGVVGIPTPWEHLNEATLGWRGGQYIVFYAKAKSFKTWLLLYCAVLAHMEGYNVLFLEQEMPLDEVLQRMSALYSGIPWGDFYRGRLSVDDEAKLENGLKEIEKSPEGSFQIERLNSMGTACVTELDGLIDKYKPDLVAFDGVYLPAGREWMVVGDINMALKRLCLRRNIPIIGTAQESEDGRISYKTFEQDADVLFRFSREQEHVVNNEILIELVMGRQVSMDPFTVAARPATDFSQKRIITPFVDTTVRGAELEDEPAVVEDK